MGVRGQGHPPGSRCRDPRGWEGRGALRGHWALLWAQLPPALSTWWEATPPGGQWGDCRAGPPGRLAPHQPCPGSHPPSPHVGLEGCTLSLLPQLVAGWEGSGS